MRRDLPDVLEDLAGIGYRMALVTNGTRFNVDLVRRLDEIPLSIAVSLDSLDRETYRNIRGRDQLQRVRTGIDMVAGGFSGEKYLAIIASRRNQGELAQLIAFARGKGFVPILGAYHWDAAGFGQSDLSLQYDREAMALLFDGIARKSHLPAGLSRRYVQDTARWLRGSKLGRCDAGRFSIAVDASGRVAPCLGHPYSGDLRHETLDDIMAGFDTGAIKKCSDASTCNLLCARLAGSALRHPVPALRQVLSSRRRGTGGIGRLWPRATPAG